jgi:hypothetical protein
MIHLARVDGGEERAAVFVLALGIMTRRADPNLDRLLLPRR